MVQTIIYFYLEQKCIILQNCHKCFVSELHLNSHCKKENALISLLEHEKKGRIIKLKG